MNEVDPVQIAIDTLNSAIAADKFAVRNLIAVRVPCNQEMADHPTIQVDGIGPNEPTVGMLGIINGIIENIAIAYGKPRRIAAMYDKRLIAFTEYDQTLIEKVKS